MSQEIVQATKPDHLDWFRKGTLYQIFPDRFAKLEQNTELSLSAWETAPSRENFFGGNLVGISSRLPYLQRIGIANLYLNPIFCAPSNHRYDAQNYFQIDPLLGDESNLANLIGSAESSKMGILLDGVFNHVGEQFPSFVQALAGDEFDRKFFDFIDNSSVYQTCGGADFLPKLNHNNSNVLQMISQVMSYWDSFGIKGWRLDVPWKIPNESWQILRSLTQNLLSSKLWLAEAWQQWEFATDFQSITNYFARTRLIDFVSRHDADSEDLVIDIEQWCRLRQDPSLITNFVGSHDTARLITECRGSNRDALIVLIMNQFLPGVPALYYGDEIGLSGGNDPDCRRTFPVDFSTEQKEFLAIIEPILSLRRKHLSLSHGNFTLVENRNRTIIVKRQFGNCQFTLVVNAGDRDQLVATKMPEKLETIVGEQVSGSTVPAHSLLIARGLECTCL